MHVIRDKMFKAVFLSFFFLLFFLAYKFGANMRTFSNSFPEKNESKKTIQDIKTDYDFYQLLQTIRYI